MKKLIFCLLIALILLSCVSFSVTSAEPSDFKDPIPSPLTNVVLPMEDYIFEPINVVKPEKTQEVIEPLASDEDIELLALLVMAEAEGECEEGQRLVIDVVLNRVDNPDFPDTIYDVVYQKNQFSGIYGERITRCYVMDELVQLVREELEHRTNHDVIFFRTEHYHTYGSPLFQVGAHYFSSYD